MCFKTAEVTRGATRQFSGVMVDATRAMQVAVTRHPNELGLYKYYLSLCTVVQASGKFAAPLPISTVFLQGMYRAPLVTAFLHSCWPAV